MAELLGCLFCCPRHSVNSLLQDSICCIFRCQILWLDSAGCCCRCRQPPGCQWGCPPWCCMPGLTLWACAFCRPLSQWHRAMHRRVRQVRRTVSALESLQENSLSHISCGSIVGLQAAINREVDISAHNRAWLCTGPFDLQGMVCDTAWQLLDATVNCLPCRG